MDRWRGKVAVVTGASSGIGLATVKALLRNGLTVVGLARRKDKMLKETSGVGPGKFYAKECDVSKEADVIDAIEFVRKTCKALHVLVNNAGILNLKRVSDSSAKDVESVIGVNLLGPVYCYQHALKLIKESGGEGYIINMNSIAGQKVPHPSWFGDAHADIHSGIYSATKFAITAVSEIFINELLGQNIRVTSINPGHVLTNIGGGQSDTEVASAVDDFQSESPALHPDDIADAIVYVLGTPTRVQITQLTIKPLGEKF